VLIRQAHVGDVEALARLRLAFRSEVARPDQDTMEFLARCADWMRPRLDRDGSWRAWVAVEAGATVGTVWLQLIEKLPNPVGEPEWHGYVSSLFVTAACRGRGVGAALLEEALAECDRRGVDAVVLWPTPRSRALYERHGFRVRDDLLERRG
jgi:GNAT superfamily N-acetyltransferase